MWIAFKHRGTLGWAGMGPYSGGRGSSLLPWPGIMTWTQTVRSRICFMLGRSTKSTYILSVRQHIQGWINMVYHWVCCAWKQFINVDFNDKYCMDMKWYDHPSNDIMLTSQSIIASVPSVKYLQITFTQLSISYITQRFIDFLQTMGI